MSFWITRSTIFLDALPQDSGYVLVYLRNVQWGLPWPPFDPYDPDTGQRLGVSGAAIDPTLDGPDALVLAELVINEAGRAPPTLHRRRRRSP